MKQALIISLLCWGLAVRAKAQDITTTAMHVTHLPNLSYRLNSLPANIPDNDYTVIPGFGNKKEITVFLGSQGFGADFRYGFLPRLSARIGGGITPVDLPNTFRVNDFKSNIDFNVRFTNVHLIADFQPFGGSGFRVAVGAGYFISAHTVADVTPTENNGFGNIILTPEELGTLKLTADWKGLAPYLGLGFFRAFPSEFFNLNLDLGTYYLAAPKTTITGTKALINNQENNDKFQKNISTYRWLPVLQLNLNFRL